MLKLNFLRQALLLACLTVGALFTTTAKASDFSTAIAGRVFCDANCNNQIDEGIDQVMMKVKVKLFNSSGGLVATTTPEATAGSYIFLNLTPGQTYTVKIVAPMGVTTIKAVPSGPNAHIVDAKTIKVKIVADGETYYPNDFLVKCCTVGYNQCEWGYNGCGWSPIDLIWCDFDELFPNGLVIGGEKTLTFTSASKILYFLPSNGYARPLASSKVNPSAYYENELAGNVLALTLNVAISDAGITTEGYGDRVLPNGAFQGMTVRELLALANEVLGGNVDALPPCVSVYQLSWTLKKVTNFSSCHCSCGSNGGWGGMCGGWW